MAYYLHKFRCWLALMRTTIAESRRDELHKEWRLQKDVAHRRNARLEMLRRERNG